jgi:hypothetical protein
MFEGSSRGAAGGATAAAALPGSLAADTEATAGFDAQAVRDWIDRLARPSRSSSDADRIEAIRGLEELKSAAAAAQAVLTADFAASQRQDQRAKGMPADQVGRGVGAQVALARRESPHRGSRLLGLAEALVHEMPATLVALKAGEISEWRATLVARETACLSKEDRGRADAELSGELGRLGDREVEARARRIAYRLDPFAYLSRTRGAVGDRRVTLRPAPDTMSRLGAFLPVAQGVAAHAELARHAEQLRAQGDPRSRGQIMADTLVERVTGQSAAVGPAVEIQLVMTDMALLGTVSSARRDTAEVDEPAQLLDYGPLPAPVARDLVRDSAKVWLRRFFTEPETGALVAMESRRRFFPRGLRRFLLVRDQLCRTPWCGAPIRHSDHVVAVEAGGATTAHNGQGLCAACNLGKQAAGWRARSGPLGAGDTVTTTTPTGHSYASGPPPLLSSPATVRGSPNQAVDSAGRCPGEPGGAAAGRRSGHASPLERELPRWLAAA